MKRKIKVNKKELKYEIGFGKTEYSGFGPHGKTKKAKNKKERQERKREIE